MYFMYEYLGVILAMNKEEFKFLLEHNPKKVQLENLTCDDIHRLSIKVGDTEFESFFMPSEYKKLYVIFSAVGIDNRPYPIFQRVTWYNNFNGMFLCIDDPTRYETGIAPTYYFGNRDVNYLDKLCSIVDKFIKLYDITYNNVTFISSSNGGFAALWCAKCIHGATCLAYNPQLNVPLFYQRDQKRLKKFEDVLNISFYDENLHERFYLDNIEKENKSKICIYSNIKSNIDKMQMDYFFNKIGKKYHYGLQKIGNIWIIIANIDSENSHLAQPSPYISRIFEQLMSDEWGGMEISNQKREIVNAFLGCMKEYYAAMKNNKELKDKIESMNK